MFGGKRWCFTTCALFMLCPRRSYGTASVPIPKSLNVHGRPIKARWFLNVVRDKGSSIKLDEVEPGFDFSKEEIEKLKIWPGGDIPYYIDDFSFDKVFRDRLRNFLDETNSATGLNFLELHRPPDDYETRWVFFVNRQSLLSCVDHPIKNFTNVGVQKVLVGYDCLSNGGGLAAVVLALVGVPPQHNAPNRNKYIEIVKDNIIPGKTYLFEILKDSEWLFHEVDYDFASASHYNLHKYTVNGKATIKPLKSIEEITIGEGKGFSDTDIWKIRMIYNYISQKLFKFAAVPKCNKLFNIGNNNSNYVSDSEGNVRPRKKPNKYLGLPELLEESPTTNKETNKDTDIVTIYTDKKTSNDENKELNSQKEHNIGNYDDKKVEMNEQLNHKSDSKSDEDSAENIQKLNEGMTDDNSLAKSNSRNDEVLEAHELKFLKPSKKVD